MDSAAIASREDLDRAVRAAPFGGFKQSGIGRNLGYEGVLEFQEYHSISGPAGWLL